jgi:phosphoglycerate dehydrogenase-like enzyme
LLVADSTLPFPSDLRSDTRPGDQDRRPTAKKEGAAGQRSPERNGSVLVASGPLAEVLKSQIESTVPGSQVVVCDPDDGTPTEGEILVTMQDNPDTVRRMIGPAVDWVHVLGTGVDRFPFDALGDRTLTCSRGASATAISEWVLAVMLAWVKRLPESWIDSPPPRWNLADLGGLAGSQLGLVGLGAIGTAVARRAQAFDMRIRALRRSSKPVPLTGIETVSEVRELTAESDHLVLAAPLTPNTHHMVDAAFLAGCKPGVHLVNVSRGQVVDQVALAAALDRGQVGRASLDVMDPEPLPAGHPLYRHPSVRLSPHISWSSPATLPLTFEMFAENFHRWRRGEALAGVVDPLEQY